MTSQIEAIKNIIDVCEIIKKTDPGNPFVKAFDMYLYQPPTESKSFDYCLGLSPGEPGKVVAATTIRMAARDQYIREAVHEIAKRAALTIWKASGEVSRLIRKFRSLSKNIRTNKKRTTQDTVERLILKIFDFDDDPPCSQQRISDIAQSNTPIDLGSIVEQ